MSEDTTSDDRPPPESTGAPPVGPGPPSASAVADWLERCRCGDPGAESVLFQAYFERLLRLVRRRLSTRLGRRLDAEDVVLSAWRSFFLRARGGKFSVDSEENLWSLLATLALRKLSGQVRRHTAEIRSADREVPLESSAPLLSSARDAETAALISDDIENLLAGLDLTDQEILIQSLQGADPKNIAQDLGCSDRTVRRSLERIRQEAIHACRNISDPEVQRRRVFAGGSASPSLPRHPDVAGLIPTHQERHIVLQRIAGQGAFTKVYRALDQNSKRTVAAKFLRPSGWREPRVVAALLREYETLRELRHPGIVGVEGWGTTRAGATFLVLEWIDGGNLGRWRDENHSIRETLQILTQVAEALTAAHARGILHGDLKPSNLLRRRNGSIVLADFGFAQRIGQDDPRLRGGTKGFFPPELLEKGAALTIQSDVFGFGALSTALFRQQAPPQIDRLVQRCLDAVPANRPFGIGHVHHEFRIAVQDMTG